MSGFETIKEIINETTDTPPICVIAILSLVIAFIIVYCMSNILLISLPQNGILVIVCCVVIAIVSMILSIAIVNKYYSKLF